MGLIRRLYKLDREEETDILREYRDVFTGLRCGPGQNHIQIDPAVAPVIQPIQKGAFSTESEL